MHAAVTDDTEREQQLLVVQIAALLFRHVSASLPVADLLPVLCLALVSALITVNKVGSPQFIAWLAVPVILGLATSASGAGHSFRTPAILVLVLAGLTHAVYPYLYVELLLLNPAILAVLTVRNLLELVLLAWFWMTPIVYPFRLVSDRGGFLPKLYMLNPVVWIVITFQRAIYNKVEAVSVVNGKVQVTNILPADVGFWYYASHLAIVGVVAGVLFILAMIFFGRVDGNFAEEL